MTGARDESGIVCACNLCLAGTDCRFVAVGGEIFERDYGQDFCPALCGDALSCHPRDGCGLNDKVLARETLAEETVVGLLGITVLRVESKESRRGENAEA